MTDPIQSTIRDIRKQLRLAMNGVVSTSMREKGATYKLNFGVSIPKIKEIAAMFAPDPELAEALWQEDVRELKILATLLQPVDRFEREQAVRWASMVGQSEIAECYTTYLLQKLPYARELSLEWIGSSEELMQLQGFLLAARICQQGQMLTPQEAEHLIEEAKTVMDAGVSRTQRAALLALKHYGRQSQSMASDVLTAFADYPGSDSPEKQEFYEDLKFEFDYYQ